MRGNPGRHDKRKDLLLQAKQEGVRHRICVYCKSEEHKSVDCDKTKGVADRRRYVSDKKLSFSCTGTRRRAEECRRTILIARGIMGSTIV